MAYVEVHQALRDHRKILALAAELEMPEAHVAGHCVFLWLWSLDNAEDGVLPASERIVERAAGWQGSPGQLVAGMIAAGMLDQRDDGSLHIHDWMDYAGRLIEKRRENAERMRSARAARSPQPAQLPLQRGLVHGGGVERAATGVGAAHRQPSAGYVARTGGTTSR